jgi:hypothetical protein
MPAREERRSTAGGQLDAEQALIWEGRWPDRPPGALLDLMERLHWRSVARYGLGLVRVRPRAVAVSRAGGAMSCDALGRVPALVFEPDGDRVEPGRIERRWRIAGGALVRSVGHGARTGGVFALGLAGRDGRLRAWVRVEAFPSRFLAPPLAWIAGRAYPAFHARVSFSYLEALRREVLLDQANEHVDPDR